MVVGTTVGSSQLDRKQKGSYISEGGGVGAGFILRNWLRDEGTWQIQHLQHGPAG